MKRQTEHGWNPRSFDVPSDHEALARAVAEFSSAALVNNYRVIQGLVPHQSILPMVKANAYGHGAEWAARNLAHLPALYGFGVATLEEGMQLRQALGPKWRRTRILVFSGNTPFNEEKGHFCEQFGLTAVIATEKDWQDFLKGGWTERIPYELKFNTGMNRLGIPLVAARSIARALRNKPSEMHPTGILTHLAIADRPESKLSVSQLERFIALKGELSGALPAAHFHLASSAGIWRQQLWGLKGLTDVVRPGLALYGIPPWQGAPARGILPVMTLKAVVAAVHRLKRGESTGYGGTFTVAGTEAVHAAVLSAGYADGIPRALSNQGHCWISGQATRFLGTVSMDLCTVGCSQLTKPGEWAEIIGANVDIWEQSRAAGTIPYELLTSVSDRVQRKYD